MTWLVVILGLAALVFLHELGHFTVARIVEEMKPRAFYVGFPPALAKVQRGGIEYGIGAIPLGGYVALPGCSGPPRLGCQAAMAPAVQEDRALGPPVDAVQRALAAGDFGAAGAALPALSASLGQAQLTRSAARSGQRAVRDVDEGSGADAYWRQPTWGSVWPRRGRASA